MNYDAIVLGCGGVGSAAAYHLARAGMRILAVDRFPLGHDRGSSHGQTRIIRQAYFEHANYVPLLRRAYELWFDLERTAGEQLFFPTGLLQVGPRQGVVVPGVLHAASQHDLPVEHLTESRLGERFPQFGRPPGMEGVFEKNAGYLLVERCVAAHAIQAVRHGAELRLDEDILGWESGGTNVHVTTSRGVYRAERLVIAAGPWAGGLLGEFGLSLRVLKKHLHWLACTDGRYRADQGCPAFLFELPEGVFYGFPQIDPDGVKAGEHSGGKLVLDPLSAKREIDAADLTRVQSFFAAHLPGVSGPPRRHTTCFYTMSPDEHLIVDRHPQHENVVFAAGLSGHGFKFTSVLGEVLCQLALDGRSNLPIEFLRLDRPALRSPSGHASS